MYLNEASYAFYKFMKTIRVLGLIKFKEYGLAGVKPFTTFILGGKSPVKRKL